MRGLAAVGVFVYHLQLEAAYRLPSGWATPLIARGYIWVDLFFILSGFVIALNYRDRLAHAGVSATRAFLAARLARLMPLHLFALWYLFALDSGLNIVSMMRHQSLYWGVPPDHHYLNLGMHALLVQIWSFDATRDWNIPAWSISAELHVYLLFPLIAASLYRAPRAAPAALAGVSFATYTWFAAAWPSLDILTPAAVLRCLAGFALGVVVLGRRSQVGALSDGALTALQGVAAAAIAGVLLSPLHDVWVIAPFAVLVWSTSTDRGLLSQLLAPAALARLGDRSYSIYLLNFPVILTANVAWPKLSAATGASDGLRLLWMTGLTIMVIVLAGATYSVIERPGGRWLGRRLSPRSARRSRLPVGG